KCVLFSTHIMHEAETLCDQMAFIVRGRITENGTADALRGRHGNGDLEEIFVTLMGGDHEGR
ncbi:MAG: hypothetical protein QME74_00355, partial [Candidatus Edwardsbacteria bacterium]|nr:hypothetical protein [Candidatus Edwardsbacteria bacterium]